MKRKSLWKGLIVIFVFFAVVAMIGCSAAEQTFTGTLEQTEKGLALKTSDGANTYRIIENPDLRAMVGKSVKLTGSLMDRQAGKSIHVKSFEVVE
jgi:hypothetical protein